MFNSVQPRAVRSTPISTLALMMTYALAILLCQSAPAQTFSVIHAFTGGFDGYSPYTGLTVDRGGHLYGTTAEYGTQGGTVFEMKPLNGNWSFSTIFQFDLNNVGVGWIPYGRVVFGPGGSLFGTTWQGGTSFNCFDFGCGSVYNLRPSPTVCNTTNCPWAGRAILSLDGESGGAFPNFVDPVFDVAGNLYGTAAQGGSSGIYGVVFKLAHANGTWTETVIHNFSGSDGSNPWSGLILDQAGNLYGTTGSGGPFDMGTVYRLSPSGSGWTLTTLYSFRGSTDGEHPSATLVFDQSGNLYGATMVGGSGGGGTIFRLSPSGGTWSFTVLSSLSGHIANDGTYPGVHNALVLDPAGNLYGSDYAATPSGYGAIFKLSPSEGIWTYTSLHDFTGGSDGAHPMGGPNFDSNGNLYGTALYGGNMNGNCGGGGCGVVWEITP